MKTNFLFASILMAILISGISGLFIIDNAFAQNPSDDDSDNTEKQKEIEQKKAERQQQFEEKQKEIEQKKAERQQQFEEKQKEIEQKKAELEIHRENFEEKQLKKLNEYQEKLKEIKAKLQAKMEKNISDDKLSQKSKIIEEKLTKSSEEIQLKLAAKADKLDLRTRNILDSINDGDYMGEKITPDNYSETYELIFDSVDASLINDNSKISSLIGKMTFTTYDKSSTDLKLELNECQITIDKIIFNCGFGKARSVSSGTTEIKDSLVILAFLEDNALEEVHTTLKIFLNSDTPINEIEQSKVSILEPQSKISGLWFLNGTATLSKITPTLENISSDDK